MFSVAFNNQKKLMEVANQTNIAILWSIICLLNICLNTEIINLKFYQ